MTTDPSVSKVIEYTSGAISAPANNVTLNPLAILIPKSGNVTNSARAEHSKINAAMHRIHIMDTINSIALRLRA